tara:strand:- start:92 stop:223 length:132 start_codon:yes stop_codon:yes gene_type:complete
MSSKFFGNKAIKSTTKSNGNKANKGNSKSKGANLGVQKAGRGK